MGGHIISKVGAEFEYNNQLITGASFSWIRQDWCFTLRLNSPALNRRTIHEMYHLKTFFVFYFNSMKICEVIVNSGIKLLRSFFPRPLGFQALELSAQIMYKSIGKISTLTYIGSGPKVQLSLFPPIWKKI